MLTKQRGQSNYLREIRLEKDDQVESVGRNCNNEYRTM